MNNFPWADSADSRCPFAAADSSIPPGMGAARDMCSFGDAPQARHPSIMESFTDFLQVARGKRLVVFLDYDGTLTPIVSDPDMAFMSDEMRSTVKRVGQTFPTAIISGRGRDKVEKFVQLDELFYAGSHGLDIKGPVVQSVSGEEHEAFPLTLEGGLLSMMAEVKHEAEAAIANIAGATVEDNTYSVSVHFRNCDSKDWPQVLAAAESIVARRDAVHMTRGRKVLEIRPRVDWDKGKALLHLLRALGLDSADDVMPVYIGDDRTDEDAFQVLQGFGVGVLVSSIPKTTAASFVLSDPHEVGAFLERIVEWGRTSADNAWHRNASCVGWAPTHVDSYPQLSSRAAGIPHVSSFCSVSTQAYGAVPGTMHPDSQQHSVSLALDHEDHRIGYCAPVAEGAALATSAACAHEFTGSGLPAQSHLATCMEELHRSVQHRIHQDPLWLGLSPLSGTLAQVSSQSAEGEKSIGVMHVQEVSGVSSSADLPQAQLNLDSLPASGAYASSGIMPMSTGEVNSSMVTADSAMQLPAFSDDAARKRSPGAAASDLAATVVAPKFSQRGVFISLNGVGGFASKQTVLEQPGCVDAGDFSDMDDFPGLGASASAGSSIVAAGSII